jgi:ATP-dependent RNA helicase SUPV3L1/SUV3
VDLHLYYYGTNSATIQVNHYERLTPLTVSKQSLRGKIENITRGDCIVTFSRKSCYAIKNTIETKTPFKSAIIYGALPPETRAEQAKLFNDPASKYDVLVASDAIGMGLNLNIKRIIFESLSKFNGEFQRPLTVSQTKQIAGRAGRFKTQWEQGEVTSLFQQDLHELQRKMKMTAPKLTVFCA